LLVDERRSGRRLHLLAHQRVLPGAPRSQYHRVAHAHRRIQIPGLRRGGATVVDTLPAAITGVTWTCVASAGNRCPASGSGSINTSAVNLLKGGMATFTVHGTVSPSASGTLSNTATVGVPAG